MMMRGQQNERQERWTRLGLRIWSFRPGVGAGLRLHDLTHDYCVDQDDRRNEISRWHNNLLDGFSEIHDGNDLC